LHRREREEKMGYPHIYRYNLILERIVLSVGVLILKNSKTTHRLFLKNQIRDSESEVFFVKLRPDLCIKHRRVSRKLVGKQHFVVMVPMWPLSGDPPAAMESRPTGE